MLTRKYRLLSTFQFGCLLGFAILLLPATAQTTAPGEWTWMGGSNTYNQAGVYGTMGTPAAGNIPGGRYGVASWTDSYGNFWLFGGNGIDANGNMGYLNDLWEFNPSTNEWAWMSGSNTNNQPGMYGTLGTLSGGNIPGGRSGAASWTDNAGNFWLFGGSGFDAARNVSTLGDLWEFNPSTNEWAWMGGSNWVGDQPGVYGTLGTPAAGNIPGSRSLAVAWTNHSGNLWLFGGEGYDSAGNQGTLNDLWEFNPSTKEWAWMGGSSTFLTTMSNSSQPGVYGRWETPAAGNIPGSRLTAVGWTDSHNNFWLFGGLGADSNGDYGVLDDLWEFNPSTNEWAWMSGSSTTVNCRFYGSYGCGPAGVYGTLAVLAATNIPGSRMNATTWTDMAGHLWLFGGENYSEPTSSLVAGYLNDLWEVDPSIYEWAWMGGGSTLGINNVQTGVYGTLGTPAVPNIPGGRMETSKWTDSSGNFWLFGGYGADANGSMRLFNDLWEYQPSSTPSYPTTAKPVLSLAPGTYTSLQSLAITDATPGAAIYYTTDGVTTPTTSSTQYTGPITVGATQTIQVVAIATNYLNSAVASANYIINLPQVATPNFSLVSGAYTWPLTVTISDSTAGATIYYTTDGSTPTTSSAVYSGPITVMLSGTLEAFATASGYITSVVSVANYQIYPVLPAPMFSPAAWIYPTPQTVSISDSTASATIYYTIDGTTPTASSAVYSGPVVVSATKTLKAIAEETGYTNSPVSAAVYTIGSLLQAQTTAPGEWTWMGGSETAPPLGSGSNGQPGVYGTLGTPAPGNIPGARYGSSTWTDSSGHLWLFGGGGIEATAVSFNDLWEFDPASNEWAWMGGSSSSGGSPVWGTPGVPAVGNIPRPAEYAPTWIDHSGNVWLLEGNEFCNDLWKFIPSTNEWGWMLRGIPAIGYSSTFCNSGILVDTMPQGRVQAATWTDNSGNLWLFGGNGWDSAGNYGLLNDFWEFYPSTLQWVWRSGATTIPLTPITYPIQTNVWGVPGVYGTLGTPAPGNMPGSRNSAVTWTDSAGNLWLFGGNGLDANGLTCDLNDLWEFNPSTLQWTWMGGSSTVSYIISTSIMNPGGSCATPAAEFGKLGIAAAANVPGGDSGATAWTDIGGNFWLFGGEGLWGTNILWEFSPSTLQWTWMGGGSATSPSGVYGILGKPAAGNIPGDRTRASGWTDSSGNFWLFGGTGFDSVGTTAWLNDVWEYQPPSPAATPAFSVAAGTYSATQTVTLSDSTTGVTIYYTTNGTTPTTSSTVYSGSITVSSTETLEAIAVASGYLTSAVASAAYTINLPPDFTVAINPTSLSVQSGQSGTTRITVQDEGGFNSNVSFTCSGLPVGAACNFSTLTVPTPAGISYTTLTVTTSTATAILQRNSIPLLPGSALAVAFCCFSLRKRRRLQILLLLAVSAVAFGLLTSCGGGGSASSGGGGGGSKSVTSTVTVIATSGSLSHSTTFSLTIN